MNRPHSMRFRSSGVQMLKKKVPCRRNRQVGAKRWRQTYVMEQPSKARFQASAAKQTRTAFFCVTTQRVEAIPYRNVGAGPTSFTETSG